MNGTENHVQPELFPAPVPDYSFRIGWQPLLVLSIHDNIAENRENRKPRREYRTREINEKLHLKLGSYLFNYFGYRSECMTNGMPVICTLVDGMLAHYKRIGIISLHRTDDYILEWPRNPIFSYGCLLGQTIDAVILEELKITLDNEDIAFFEGQRQIGGKEIRKLHELYNDPSYEYVSMKKDKDKTEDENRQLLEDLHALHREKNQHDPKENDLQIIQLEFAWRVPNEEDKNNDRPLAVCRALVDIMLQYLKS
jgi:hypothetical protein